MMWQGGQRMARCRQCGDVFAVRNFSQQYCHQPWCQKERRKTWVRKPENEHGGWTSKSVRQAERDAKAALEELRAWVAEARRHL